LGAKARRVVFGVYLSRGGMGWQRLSVTAVLALSVAACTHDRTGPVETHFQAFQVQQPAKNTVTVCHAYTCKMQTKFTFNDADINELKSIFKKVKKEDSAFEERRAVAYAVGWMENRVGKVLGTDKDRPGMDFAASGDPTQQDCVDESTNTTSYMLVLQNNGLLKYHTVGTPFSKDQLWRGVAGWTHWTAVLKEAKTEQRWAVDSWIYENGENPAIVEVEKWYIEDLGNLPVATR
jgi:hypothetical protein